MDFSSPEAIAQRQLDAYNARDLEALIATYDDRGRQYEFPGTLLACGHAEIRERYVERFKEPDLNARLLKRIVLGHVVVEQKIIQRNFPEGLAQVDIVSIYEVRDGKIRNASFIYGTTTMLGEA